MPKSLSKKLFKSILIWSLLFLLISAICSSSVLAQEDQDDQAQAVPGFPLIYELSAAPGEPVTQTAVVTNFKEEEMQIQTAVLDFEIIDEDGGIRFSNVVNDAHKLASWIVVDEPVFNLKPNETAQVEFKISAPQDAIPGAHWAMIIFQGVNVKGEKKVETLAGTNALVLLTVKDEDLTSKAEVKSFKAQKNSERQALELYLRMANTSKAFIKPRGTITITNIWGQKVDEITLTPVIVFPETIAKILTEWKPDGALSLGRYTIELKGYYGSNSIEFDAKTSIWILPWEVGWTKYLAIGIGALIFLIIVFKIFKLEVRRKRRE